MGSKGDVAKLMGAPHHSIFFITTMKGLLLKTLLYNYFFHNLQSGVTWEMRTASSSQDRSKLLSVFIPMMLKIADKKEIATLNVVKPDINTDQSEWRLGIETTAEILQNRIEINLRLDESKY